MYARRHALANCATEQTHKLALGNQSDRTLNAKTQTIHGPSTHKNTQTHTHTHMSNIRDIFAHVTVVTHTLTQHSTRDALIDGRSPLLLRLVFLNYSPHTSLASWVCLYIARLVVHLCARGCPCNVVVSESSALALLLWLLSMRRSFSHRTVLGDRRRPDVATLSLRDALQSVALLVIRRSNRWENLNH